MRPASGSIAIFSVTSAESGSRTTTPSTATSPPGGRIAESFTVIGAAPSASEMFFTERSSCSMVLLVGVGVVRSSSATERPLIANSPIFTPANAVGAVTAGEVVEGVAVAGTSSESKLSDPSFSRRTWRRGWSSAMRLMTAEGFRPSAESPSIVNDGTSINGVVTPRSATWSPVIFTEALSKVKTCRPDPKSRA